MSEEFKPGDLVYLISGSPKMVVVGSNENETRVLWCQYGTDKIQDQTVPTVVLRKRV